MAESLMTQIDKLRRSIQGLEAQRQILGDEVVNTALAALQQQLAGIELQLTEQAAPVEERRMVTILFMDMVGSTPMAEKMDPEEWRQDLSKIHTTLGEIIIAHHGTVVQYLGDGLLALFGSKEASEYDPENAIRAALDSHSAAANLSLPEILQLRAGIHTGLVVVGELGDAIHKEFTASGDAMNLAARLQSAAPPGGTLISHDTYRYVRGVFDLTPRPPLSVKGKSEPVQTYLVRRAKPRPFRSVTRGVAGVETRTVGRDVELQTLQHAYMRADEGHGLVWTQLLSELGVGKSRLLADLTDWIDLHKEDFCLLRARAFPDDANQPFALIRRMWFDRFQIAEDTPLGKAEAKWVERFKEFSGLAEFEEPAHILGLLVGLPFTNSTHIKAMRDDPNQVKGRAVVVSRELVKAVRKESLLVVLLEDLQWTDQASWEYLMEVFVDDGPGMQSNGVFILGAARPEWRPPQILQSLLSTSLATSNEYNKWGIQILLPPLSDQSVRELAQELFHRAINVPGDIIDLLVNRSEGVPYYTEEMVNWFIDHGILDTHTEQWRFIPEKFKVQPLPSTLQHLLLTRLSALSQPERTALQCGSIFGRRFWTGGVEALGVPAGGELLGYLQARGFLDLQPESAFEGDTEWSFHHNLFREVTYESVLKRERAALHKVAASWLERQARQAGRLEEFTGLLGNHCERAGELSAASDWYLLAGKRAFNQGAAREALGFYTQALDLLPPIERERRWQVLLAREDTLRELSDPEQWKVDIAAMLELARSFDDDRYLAEAFLRQAVFGMRSAEKVIYHQAAAESLAAARRCGNEAIECKALAITALVDIDQGDKSAAIHHIEDALRIARTLGDDNVLLAVISYAASCYTILTIPDRLYPLQTERIEIAHRLGDRLGEAAALHNIGSVYVRMGLFKRGRILLEQARAINAALGIRRMLASNLMSLSEMYRMTGDQRKAYQMAEQALQEISLTQDISGKISALDYLGRVLLAMGDAPTATKRFTEESELALSHGELFPTYEAATGLAAAAMMQGQLDLAREYISGTCDYLKEHGWLRFSNPGLIFRTCAEVYDALGDTEDLRALLEIAQQSLIELLETFNVPELRQSLLENNTDTRAILDMIERMKNMDVDK